MRVELEDVRKRYGRVAALDGVTLDVPAGARVALVGPNGSGKSTLTRVIMGLATRDGQVRVDGRDPFVERHLLARRLAYAPQTAPQAAATVGELVAAIARLRGIDPARVGEVAARLDLDLSARELSRRPFRALSGGMKSKALLALALSAEASLYVLDEPTASLDARSRAAFFRLFAELSPSATLILCSHRLEEIRHLVDRVVHLEEGRVCADGAVEPFLAARASTVIELLVAKGADRHAGWLRARGFAPGARGWWARVTTQEEKRGLLPDVIAALGDDMRDVIVRELDSVEVGHA